VIRERIGTVDTRARTKEAKMADNGSKLKELLTTSRDPAEVQDWLFSLIPLGVAFVFFFIFLLPMDVPDKNLILITGFAAGFAGLESYWVLRGWKKNHGSTVVMGLMGIAVTFGVLGLYIKLS
jgi:hypothetical protein